MYWRLRENFIYKICFVLNKDDKPTVTLLSPSSLVQNLCANKQFKGASQ